MKQNEVTEYNNMIEKERTEIEAADLSAKNYWVKRQLRPKRVSDFRLLIETVESNRPLFELNKVRLYFSLALF